MSIFATGKKKPADSPNAEATGGKSAEESTPHQEQAGKGKPAAGARPGTRPALKETSSLGAQLKFEGTLNYTGTVTVNCHFKGSIITDDTLVVGPSGQVDAEVTAGVVEISGKVHGNVKALKNVKILKGGQVHGNIETPKISMEEGVVFEGNCSRPADAPMAPAAKPSSPAAKPLSPAAKPSSPPPAATRVTSSPSAAPLPKPPVGS